ncbi:M4 family metallopeptidase [Chryseobacterium oryctis]|uniref:Neutral metalloproteinase n=1 Tax=Chryseobacterium oryctis TaxID=2952618 RepID=A0ABT3HRW5_9FLAO|nr:M4 family metallopeptidase [Chryseobacterium oryctis]MCW3162522.1 M4 family metallopeptidase [Chryseobacterium oryctis]
MKKITTIIKTLAFTLALGIAPLSIVQAQNRDNQEISVKDLPRISKTSVMGNFNANFSGLNIPSGFLTSHLGEWLGTDNDHSYKLVKETKDELGIKHSTYEHYYKGVKVMDDMVLVHEKDGKLIYVNGEIITNINLSPKQQPTSTKIKSIIASDIKAQGKITVSNVEEVIAKVNKGRSAETYHTSKVEALSMNPIQAYTYYIDNNTSAIIKKLSRLHDADTPSVSATYYKGNQSITVDSYNGQYRLKDNTRNIHTMNGTNLDIDTVNGGIINVEEYISPTANFTTDATKPAVEVHWGMKTAYDYYINKHNRNSYDGLGSKIDNYYNVDFGPSAGGLNAGALDTPLYGGIVCMLYGNGTFYNGLFSLANPLVAVDVAGHEYSHLIIGRNGLGGLNYEGESGAINESIADMMGTAIEFYSNVTPNWTMGEGITKPSLFDASPTPHIRDLSNPNNAQSLLGGPQPDTYNGTHWADPTDLNTDKGGVHTNSGVGNYWFYLLSAGGSGTNDIGNTFSVTGIGIDKAEKIIYRALTTYMTPNTNYMDAYNFTKQAVTDLYGANGNEQLQNVKAWYAVGIGDGALATNEVNNNNKDQFKIYPNPVKNGVFTIENNLNDASFEIYDISGRIVKQNQKLNKGTNKIEINGVQKGVYLVKVNSAKNTISKKIVVE